MSGNGCQPGDITVTAVERGFMLRRVLQLPSKGRWWHYIATLDNRDVAVRLARRFATAHSVRAWVYENNHTFTEIPLGRREQTT